MKNISESKLKKIIQESVRKAILENDDTFGYNFPDELYEIGKQLQEINVKLERLCGDTRFGDDEEVHNIVTLISNKVNEVCGDLNENGIAPFEL
jgi:archaellum component FlaC